MKSTALFLLACVSFNSPISFPVGECVAAVVIGLLQMHWDDGVISVFLCFLCFGVWGDLIFLNFVWQCWQKIVAFVVHHHDHCMD